MRIIVPSVKLGISVNLAALIYVLPTSAQAAETVIHEYDALGRLVTTVHSGTINNGQKNSLCYDNAGNRSVYQTDSNGAGLSCPFVTPLPTVPATPVTPPTFSVSNASAVEGGNAVFTIAKQGATTSSYSVNWTTANSSAIAGSDFVTASGTAIFTAAETAKTITITTVEDGFFEQTEIFHLNLSNPTNGALLANAQGTATVSDNDAGSNPPGGGNCYYGPAGQLICN